MAWQIALSLAGSRSRLAKYGSRCLGDVLASSLVVVDKSSRTLHYREISGLAQGFE